LTHQVVKRAHDFVHRSHAIPDVQPKEVDVIRFQSPQRSLYGFHALTVIAGGIRIISRGRDGVFGRQHNLLPVIAHEFTKPRFAGPIGVNFVITVGM
jgi:hypothetical protein